MTKDDFHKSAQEMNKPVKKDTSGSGAASQVRAPAPPTPAPPGPKPPFGMPVMPVIKSTAKPVTPPVLPKEPEKED